MTLMERIAEEFQASGVVYAVFNGSVQAVPLLSYAALGAEELSRARWFLSLAQAQAFAAGEARRS